MLTIGINHQEMHDSSACIANDGTILFAIAEERLSRIKHDSTFPVKSVNACLNYVNATLRDVDSICVGRSHPIKEYFSGLRSIITHGQYYDFLYHTYGCIRNIKRKSGMNTLMFHFGEKKPTSTFFHVDHHYAHAISAYAFSGFDEATVIVIDARGAWEATSIWHGQNGILKHVHTIPWPNSIGLFYSEFTYYLGFEKCSDEWKVMGLAPYGEPGVDISNFIEIEKSNVYTVNATSLLGKNAWDVSGIESVLGPRRIPESDIEQRHKDIAFAVQSASEKAIAKVVKYGIGKTGARKLCLAGGVALNSKANGKLLASGLIEDIFIQPAPSDDGVALGAALYPTLKQKGHFEITKLRNIYWGPDYADEEIRKLLVTYKLPFRYEGEVARETAHLLANGKIIGWFQGRMEFGPRSLGNRAILADPRDPLMKDRVNNAVKFREVWRPFAPSILSEKASEYFQNGFDSPFMILTDVVIDSKRKEIPAVTHVDYTVRPQTVEKEVNPLFWALINEFFERTGIPVVMNTSFNLRGEPIVCTPVEAIRTFMTSGLDVLVLGNYILEKSNCCNSFHLQSQ